MEVRLFHIPLPYVPKLPVGHVPKLPHHPNAAFANSFAVCCLASYSSITSGFCSCLGFDRSIVNAN